MGDGRLGDSDQFGQVAHTALSVTERVDEPHACGIAQQLEHFGHGMDGAGSQQSRPHVLQCGDVGCVHVASVGGGHGGNGCERH